MTFVMESMIEEDHAKIFTATTKALIGKYCGVDARWNPSSNNSRAIDRERDAIFLRLQAWAPRDGIHRYLLVIEGTSMVIQMGSGGSTGTVVLPIDMPDQFKSRVEEIRTVICDAFLVHGFFGVREPLNPIDIPTPTFE